MNEASDGFFSPRHSPLGLLTLRDTGGIIPSKGMCETTDPEKDVINDNEYANERDPHYSRV